MSFFVIKLRHIIIALLVIIIIPVVWFSVSRTASVFLVNGREVPIYSVERDDNKIALTFDCAWGDEDMDAILTTLDKYGVKATFFVVGTWVENYPDALRKIKEHGHEIGNHSYNHADYTKLGAENIISDLDKCDSVIENVIGEKPYLMRAPSGGYNDTVITATEKSGRTYIQWSVDGIDYGDAEPQAIYDRSVTRTEAGDIILLHTGTKSTANVLPKILEALECKYEFATVSELIYRENYKIDNAGRQFQN
ncbi:MAG: polysaccharide deacetylase family protein [Clostridia bacterium]|nr:polysaccharide deacetylase family protein [Clostridia bacterium]MCI9085045.1 polysaccharide deacetylase family protein [Clostridia bacterium]